MDVYYKHSKYLMEKYKEKVYKLPINLPGSCPNRDGTKGFGGCIFCGEKAAGFEALPPDLPVKEQLLKNKEYIGKKYKAKKFIAYFQNYTNTYLPIEVFKKYINEAAIPGVVEIAISTRPDCLEDEYLSALKELKEEKNVEITVELGLQSARDETLKIINRGHDVLTFINGVYKVKEYGFRVVAHIIINLPWDDEKAVLDCARLLNNLKVDGVKIHSLYIVKNTPLCRMYENGEIKLISYGEFKSRVKKFLMALSPDIVVERLFGRAPEEEVVFENYGSSWRKIHDEIVCEMIKEGSYQGKNVIL